MDIIPGRSPPSQLADSLGKGLPAKQRLAVGAGSGGRGRAMRGMAKEAQGRDQGARGVRGRMGVGRMRLGGGGWGPREREGEMRGEKQSNQ